MDHSTQPLPRRPLRVVLARSGRCLDVPPERSVLDVVLAAKVHVRHACHTGHCGACEVTVLQGQPQHFDPVYRYTSRPPADRMKLCVSRALTPQLTLDLCVSGHQSCQASFNVFNRRSSCL